MSRITYILFVSTLCLNVLCSHTLKAQEMHTHSIQHRSSTHSYEYSHEVIHFPSDRTIGRVFFNYDPNYDYDRHLGPRGAAQIPAVGDITLQDVDEDEDEDGFVTLWIEEPTDLAFLDGCTVRAIRGIIFSDVEITDSMIGYLRTLPNLRNIDLLYNKKVDVNAMGALFRLKHLKRLHISGNAITEEHIRKIRHLPIESLTLETPHLNANMLESILTMRPLKQLRILQSPLKDEDLNIIARIENLEDLDLDFTQITDAGLANLKSCEKLRSLNLTQENLTDNAIDSILKIPNLSELYIHHAAITDEGLKKISQLKNMQVLRVAPGFFTSEGLRQIQDMPKLRELDFSVNTMEPKSLITNKGIEYIARIRSLESLYLTGNPITDDSIHELKKMKQLKDLYLEKTKISEKGIRRIQQALPDCLVSPML